VLIPGNDADLGDKANTEPLPKDYVQTFYPNVLEEKASQPVNITAGEVKRLDLVLRDVRHTPRAGARCVPLQAKPCCSRLWCWNQ